MSKTQALPSESHVGICIQSHYPGDRLRETTDEGRGPQTLGSEYKLDLGDLKWLGRRDWLKEKGYVLRPKFQDGWVPSWITNPRGPASFLSEDGVAYGMYTNVMDATRTKDGAFVMLKVVDVHTRRKQGEFEVELGTWFSADPQRSDPENHCVPIYEVLQPPGEDVQIIVMPLLTRYDKPRFDTIGEAVSFFRQIFEGINYMHKHHIAHRDCAHSNLMMDGSPIFTSPFHPVDHTMKRDFSGKVHTLSRTRYPVKYYITDFGYSCRYNPGDPPPTLIIGADKTVPEFQADDAPDCDPFPVDVYYLGNLVRVRFLEGGEFCSRKRGFEFMRPLVTDMVNDDPSLRPKMAEVVERFEQVVQGLSSWKLRSRVAKDEHSFGFTHSISHWIRKVQLVIGRYPAIPMP